MDGQAIAVVHLPPAVGLGEELEVALPLLERPLAVLALVELEVALDDVSNAQLPGGRVIARGS